MNRRLSIAIAALLALNAGLVQAQAAPPQTSALDAPSFYQLLLGELDLREGDAVSAFAKFIDVARRTRDDGMFRRAVEVALQAHSGDQALAATRAWRQAVPDSLDAVRFEMQILAVLNRGGEMAEPIRSLIARTQAADRSVVISALPRLGAQIGRAHV